MLVERAITVIITAAPASANNPNPITFGSAKQNTLTLAGYRVSVEIDWPGGGALVTAEINIFGMNLSDMNEIASIGQFAYASNLNTVSVLAGDNENGTALVFQGNLQAAAIDAEDSPNISFYMTAAGGYALKMTPVPPASFGGAASVATIMANIAKSAGYAFENNGVTTVLSNPYFPGTAGQQIEACRRAANINAVLDVKTTPNTLAIWPKFGNRGGDATPVNAQTGMIGYPRYTNWGIDVDMLFNPNLVYGGQVSVTSILPSANGTFNIYALNHRIESITKNGDG